MSPVEVAAIVQAGAAVLTLGAAGLALLVTSEAPKRAAHLAEELRIKSEHAAFRRQEKYRIFRTLMEHRGRNISAPEPVNALNMIDVVFHESRSVREAWSEFQRFADGAQNHQSRMDNYLKICVETAKVLGFPDTLTVAEIDRGYYPQRV